MGKIDDMRRLREQQFAEAEALERKAPARPASPAPAPLPATAAPAPRAAEAPAAQRRGAGAKVASDTKGECSGCGKQKPIDNGLIAQHMKGLGKMCSGSRKAPA